MDRDAAPKRFVAEWPDILPGRSVEPVATGTTVAELANHFLTAKRGRGLAFDRADFAGT